MKKLFFVMCILVFLSACTTPPPAPAPAPAPDPTPTEETTQATYTAYTETKYQELLGTQPFAVFFHAQWCPVCRKMEEEITSQLSTLPSEIMILKANYDTETELKKTYGITSQSTIVIIDAEGNAVTTLAAPDVEDITEAFNAL